MQKQQLYHIFKTALKNFLKDDSMQRAAALTFFIILPLPTLLLLATEIFSLFYGPNAAVQIVVQQITAVVGPVVAGLFSQLIANTASPFTSVWTTIVVLGFSIGGAIGAFSVLRDTMDCIWNVTLPSGRPLWKRIRQRIVPFVLVSALGLIVISWTAVANGIFSLIKTYALNGLFSTIGVAIAGVGTSFGVATLLLAIIYKMIPEARVHWRDVTIASIVTGVAFTVTNYVFGAYIAYFTPTTVAGAGGALLIILLWVFVLNQIVLFGAETSKVYATTVGTYARKSLPESLERIVQPLERVGEKVEQATKEDVVSTDEPPVKSEQKPASTEHATGEKDQENR
jgi:membrane protein